MSSGCCTPPLLPSACGDPVLSARTHICLSINLSIPPLSTAQRRQSQPPPIPPASPPSIQPASGAGVTAPRASSMQIPTWQLAWLCHCLVLARACVVSLFVFVSVCVCVLRGIEGSEERMRSFGVYCLGDMCGDVEQT
ncbi:hypothetical protein EJ05DRAFT_365556 [Pseudovirgaria hyperparasitica]|uniref:Uncharacterized protein n=1 Tax=Pseudovirgaria hyperparasitica TaxID=470096 RepID=A0A6A6W9H3_9PEZI|nr:uncharacterized protein EJ05DRAFT_365556 [Pseudovirgaria hyperparasitica]KAF2758809.1 hypothetical protein EJ05DRAFT_365556 [Pseudovirgaria hyperparasitica]